MMKNNDQGFDMELILLHAFWDGSYYVVVENHIVCEHVMVLDMVCVFFQDGDGFIIMMHM